MLHRCGGGSFSGHTCSKGCAFPEPLKPMLPELAQEITFPSGSLMVTMVLLNVDRMCATPTGIFLRALRRGRCPPLRGLAIGFSSFQYGLSPLTGNTFGTFASSCIGLSTLPSNRKAAAVTYTTVATDVPQSLDVHVYFPAKVTFDQELLFNDLADLIGLVLS